MESELKDFCMISKPLKTVYDNQLAFSNEKFKDASKIKIFEVVENRYFGLSMKSGIFFEMTKRACEEIKKKKQNENYEISKDINDQLQILAKVGVFSSNVIKTEYKYITKINLNLCHICNLRCKYCFAEGGTYGQEEIYMTQDTAIKAINLFVDQLPNNASANIIFFGGEPLINIKLLKWIIRYTDEMAFKKNIKVVYDIFTNGTLLNDDIGNLMQEKENIRVLLSMDGSADINDNFRQAADNSHVTEIIERNLKYIKSFLDKRVVVRCTVGWEKEDLLDRIYYFSKMGFKNIVIDPAYCKDLPGVDNTDQIMDSILRQLPKVSKYLVQELKKGNRINVNLISEMLAQILKNGNGEVNYEVPQCPGGRCYVAIDSTGEIYPCHYFVGMREYSFGNVHNNNLRQKNMIINNGKRNLEKCNDDFCANCDLAVICEGACPYKSLVLFPDNLSIRKKFCNYMLRRIEESLKLLSNFYNYGKMPYSIMWEMLYDDKKKGER